MSDPKVVGRYEAIAKPVKGQYGPETAAWTDGVSLHTEVGEPLTAFRLIEGERYRITVERLSDGGKKC